jgi:hypothetical protein
MRDLASMIPVAATAAAATAAVRVEARQQTMTTEPVNVIIVVM